MPLPALNTGGVDISNTIAQIDRMKTGALQRQNLMSEMAARDATAPALADERKSTNALRLLQQKREQLALEESKRKSARELEEDAVKAALYVKGAPDKFKAYDEVLAKHPHFPAKSYFVTTDESGQPQWDEKTYTKFADGARDAVKLEHNPEEGKSEWRTTVNPKFDPSKEVSADNPKLVEVKTVIRNGHTTIDEEAPIKPVVDTIAKEQSEELHKRKAEEHQKKGEELQAEHNRIMAKNADNLEARVREMERWNREKMLFDKEKEAKKTSVKFKQIDKNEKGEPIRIMSDGTAQAMDTEGEWVPATVEQMKGITHLGSPQTEAEKLMGDIRKKKEVKTQPKKTESELRAALNAKGVVGTDADEWMKKYKAAGIY